jgi:hypothetical protein
METKRKQRKASPTENIPKLVMAKKKKKKDETKNLLSGTL